MKKRSVLRRAAKIYCSNVLQHILGSGASSDLLSDDDMEYFSGEVTKIALRVHAKEFSAGTLDECILMAENKQH